MLFMLVNKTRTNLSAEEFAHLAELAKDFYANIPAGVTLHSDWAALDGSKTYALIEAGDESVIGKMQAPFRPYVDIEIVPVRKLSGWEIS
jgi:Domain of unknown function (DUF3303)